MESVLGSRKRRAQAKPPDFDHKGRTLCRCCDTPVEGRRTVFCSDQCAHEWKIRHDPHYAKAAYIVAYGDLCVGCKRSEATSRHHYNQAYHLLHSQGLLHLLDHFPEFQLDHIRPVADGGGECGLDNFRLLCQACHKPVTARFNKDRAQRRKESSPWLAVQRAKQGYKQPLPEGPR